MKRDQTINLFTPKERQETMQSLVKKFYEDDRILGVIHVGSSAYGFKDKYSDIDMVSVVDDSEDLMVVFNDWKKIIHKMFSVIHSFEVIMAQNSLLHGFLLDNFLELDIGFQTTSNIYAKRKDWKISFDKTNELEDIMKNTWKERQIPTLDENLLADVQGSWYYVSQVLIALARNNNWRAIFELEKLKQMIVQIVNQRFNYKIKRFNEIKKLPKRIQNELESLLIPNTNKQVLLSILQKTVKILYREAKETYKGSEKTEIELLENSMLQLIQTYKQLKMI
jgi:hypothetical protein